MSFLSRQSCDSTARISLRENEVCFASLKQTNLQVKIRSFAAFKRTNLKTMVNKETQESGFSRKKEKLKAFEDFFGHKREYNKSNRVSLGLISLSNLYFYLFCFLCRAARQAGGDSDMYLKLKTDSLCSRTASFDLGDIYSAHCFSQFSTG